MTSVTIYLGTPSLDYDLPWFRESSDGEFPIKVRKPQFSMLWWILHKTEPKFILTIQYLKFAMMLFQVSSDEKFIYESLWIFYITSGQNASLPHGSHLWTMV